MSTSIDQIAENIVRNDVHANVSCLVSELMYNDDYVDDLLEVAVQYSYTDAVTDHLNGLDDDGPDAAYARELTDCHGTHAAITELELDPELAEEFCDDIGIEPHEHEVLEHWIISGWLADHLENQGEPVLRGFYGLTIWGRTTSGQAIDMDGVIRRIAESIHI